jgi:glutathione synthase/RimK-type ligase-like ATP-grasp enzyme
MASVIDRCTPACVIFSIVSSSDLYQVRKEDSLLSTIAFVTYRDRPQLTAEDQRVCSILQRYGVKTQAVIWDAPDIRWNSYDAVVVRSCWDYHLQPSTFSAWLADLERLQVPLWNPVPILRWNLHKSYLHDLHAQGVAIPPTCWLARGCQADLKTVLADHGWAEAVIKPAISATAYQTWRTIRQQGTQDQPHFAASLQHADLLVQQFMEPVVKAGEWSFVFFHKQYSHAVLKKAKAGDFRVQDDFGGTVEVVSPGRRLLEQAQQIINAIAGPLLFARVDGIELEGQLVLMELELIEPFLFLDSDPQASERFARAILTVLPNHSMEPTRPVAA